MMDKWIMAGYKKLYINTKKLIVTFNVHRSLRILFCFSIKQSVWNVEKEK